MNDKDNTPHICKSCIWYHDDFEICLNSNSKHCADFRLESDSCDFWDERSENDECSTEDR